MKYRIVQYIQPWDIDDLERQIHTMILSSYHIDETDDIIWDITLNVSDHLINWNSTTITKSYILNKFDYLKKLVNQYFIAEFDTDDTILGCVDKRRSCCNKKQDFIIWLDSDIYFSPLTLPYLVISSKQLTNQSFMISPQIIKYWDSSWDCIVYDSFLLQPYNHRDFFDAYSIDRLIQTDQITVKLNQNMKFGGGWFNLFSNSVFELIPIPDELGSYGWEDTYVMMCANKHKIPQYLLNGIFVTEIGNRYLDGKNYLKEEFSINTQDHNKISEQQFQLLITKYYQS